jgi:phage baseplate assembly protein W
MIQIVNSTLPLGLDGYAVSAQDSFIDALKTPKGSVIGNFNYGTDWFNLKHKPYNSNWKLLAKRYCKDACAFDKRLNFTKLEFNEDEILNGKIYLDIHINNYVLKGISKCIEN